MGIKQGDLIKAYEVGRDQQQSGIYGTDTVALLLLIDGSQRYLKWSGDPWSLQDIHDKTANGKRGTLTSKFANYSGDRVSICCRVDVPLTPGPEGVKLTMDWRIRRESVGQLADPRAWPTYKVVVTVFDVDHTVAIDDKASKKTFYRSVAAVLRAKAYEAGRSL